MNINNILYKWIMFLLCLLLVVLAYIIYKQSYQCPEKVSLIAAGDTMLSRWMHRSLNQGKREDVFNNIGPILRNADLAYVNLETVLSARGEMAEKGEPGPFMYRGRSEMVHFLKDAGIDMVNQANNHAGDYGPEALMDSISLLRDNRIRVVGAGSNKNLARAVQYVKVKGVTLGFISLTTYPPSFDAGDQSPGAFYAADEDIVAKVIDQIKEAKKFAHVVIFSPHWGENWKKFPTEQRRKVAHQLIDAGVDLIIGHSSHVLQPIEIYKDKLIVYDMGSLLFDSVSRGMLRNSMLFDFTISTKGVEQVTLKPIYLSQRSVKLAEGGKKDEILKDFINSSKMLDGNFNYHLTNDSIEIKLKVDSRFWRSWRWPVSDKLEEKFTQEYNNKPPCVLKEVPPEGLHIETVLFKSRIQVLASYVSGPMGGNFSPVVKIYLSSKKRIKGNYELVVSIRKNGDPAGPLLASYAHEPGNWSYPTYSWQTGEIIEDAFLLRTPRHLKAGRYDVVVKIIQMKAGKATPGEDRIISPARLKDHVELKVGELVVLAQAGSASQRGLRPYDLIK